MAISEVFHGDNINIYINMYKLTIIETNGTKYWTKEIQIYYNSEKPHLRAVLLNMLI